MIFFRKRALAAEVAAMQTRMLPVTGGNVLFDEPFFKDRVTLRPLLESFLDGFQPDFSVLERMRYMGGVCELMADILAKRPNAYAMFTDDALFSNQKFFVMTALGNLLTPKRDQELFTLSSAQLVRMFAAGVVDPRYVLHMRHRGFKIMGEYVVDDLVLAHDDSMRETIANRNPLDAGVLVGLRLREQLFHERWLPKMIAQAEYAQVREFTPSVTQGLYPVQWAAGYAGYRAALGFEPVRPMNVLVSA